MAQADETARPPYIKFEQRAEPDRNQSEAEGRTVFKNVDYIIVVPPGGKQEFENTVTDYFAQKRKEVIDGRFQRQWLDYFERAYAEWQKGNDLPLNGTPIREWPVATPADKAQLIAANVLTVEDLAEASQVALDAIGMNGRHLQIKAKAWFQAANDKGKLAEKVASLEEELDRRNILIEGMNRKLEELEREMKKGKRAA